ncbi:MAG TPA: type II secretion system F family protein [Chroococcales cyanobacterium]|jgi:type IV pilus assembly protein PilC
MPTFSCKVRDSRGEAFIKELQGDSSTEVRVRLREMGYMIVTPVIEKREGKSAAKQVEIPLLKKINDMMAMSQKVKLTDLTIFSRQFATMINAGVAMVRALTILAQQTGNPRLAKILQQVQSKVEEGSALSDSLGKYPDIFDKLFVGMVRAGEAGGVLDEVLLRVAGFQESSAKLQGQVKSALTYPIVVLVLAVLIFIGMLLFILPVFAKMFAGMDAKLPAYTQFLIDMSNTIASPIGAGMAAGIFAIAYAFRSYAKTDHGRHFLDGYMLKLPVFGPVTQKVAVARFTRTLGTLLRSGVPLLNALEIVRDSAGNMIISGAVEDIRQAVREGEGISKPLEKAEIFPPMVTQMISIGEETGAIDAMLEKVADFYDEEVEQAVKSLTSLLEPLMMVFIGLMVGSIIIGMYLPIFSIINTIK